MTATPSWKFRIPDAERRDAQTIARLRGESLTSVVRAAIRRYIARNRALLDSVDR